ncbi:MAG: hypothetical protein LQ338_004442 [Usnochroma carphineum]|nr:MAG: hypothetical protein LQ338_004442 [Usnochroma carphineum]
MRWRLKYPKDSVYYHRYIDAIYSNRTLPYTDRNHIVFTTKSTSTSSGPSPTQSGITSRCTKYYKTVSGDTCQVISDRFGTFSVAQFETWNPAVGNDCSQLFLSYYYCIAVPGTPTTRSSTSTSTTSNITTPTPNGPQPQQPGIISNCSKFYLVKSGDSCYTIEQAQKVSAANFQEWNTGIKTDCSNLFVGHQRRVNAACEAAVIKFASDEFRAWRIRRSLGISSWTAPPKIYT